MSLVRYLDLLPVWEPLDREEPPYQRRCRDCQHCRVSGWDRHGEPVARCALGLRRRTRLALLMASTQIQGDKARQCPEYRRAQA